MALEREVCSTGKNSALLSLQSETGPKQPAMLLNDINVLCSMIDFLEELTVPIDIAFTSPARETVVHATMLRQDFIQERPCFLTEFLNAEYVRTEEDNKLFIPDDFVLYQPYPNPFNESVTVKYGVPEASDVIITLYDATGRVVRVLTQGQHQPGIHILQVSSATLNSGVYFCRLVASGKERTVKLVCVK